MGVGVNTDILFTVICGLKSNFFKTMLSTKYIVPLPKYYFRTRDCSKGRAHASYARGPGLMPASNVTIPQTLPRVSTEPGIAP